MQASALRQVFSPFRLLLALVLLLVVVGVSLVLAQRPTAPLPAASPFHPTFRLLDEQGNPVQQSGQPVSTMKTCGACHDTAFIVAHNFHADLGLSTYQPVAGSWDASTGWFGQWNPLTYRYLSQVGDEQLDLSTAEWLMRYGERIPGGGPATTSRNGQPLTSLPPDPHNPETSILDPQTGQPVVWDWQQSGVMELNCFLCHLENPDTAARAEEIRAGRFAWANTATLQNLGLVRRTADGWQANPEVLAPDGTLKAEFVKIQDPTNANCAACHGVVHGDTRTPLAYAGCALDEYQTATTGQIIAAQRISFSGLNLSGKAEKNYAFDVHAERALKCTDCHYSLNNPAHTLRLPEHSPEHLTYDPRRLDLGDYLRRPDHNLARGQSAQYNVAPELKATMRRCESCHDAPALHADWLPYTERHLQVLACESCHIPQLYAPALQSVDWTVITPAGEAVSQCRGVEGDGDSYTDLITGFEPVLLQRQEVDGQPSLTTYNLITTWYWVYDDAEGNPRPVRLADLKAVYLDGGAYHQATVAAFDSNGDGQLSAEELRIDNAAKREFVAGRLAALGLRNPRIEGQIQPFSINHNVVGQEAALKDCEACHTAASRVTHPMTLATHVPAGVIPTVAEKVNVSLAGEIAVAANGALVYRPSNEQRGIYVFGHNRVAWVDWLGAAFFVGVLLAVAGHGTLRYVAALRRPKGKPRTQRMRLYEAYERLWHWLQTLAVVLLLFTGLVIHRPDIFGLFAFRYMVTVHNGLAALLVINAFLALFWHLTTGEIRQFIPRPRGFFDDALVQLKFYLGGIFKGEPHPFEKRREKKMNPLQQATYFGLLNVLLPLQVVTGALMWGVQQAPQVANWFGGLPVLAPVHSLVAWLFGAFIVGHVYLTTTGVTPLESIRGMITGWEEVEVHGVEGGADEHEHFNAG